MLAALAVETKGRRDHRHPRTPRHAGARQRRRHHRRHWNAEGHRREKRRLSPRLARKISPPCTPISKSFSPIRRWRRECANHRETDAGHGRIEERCARAADAGWLSKRHPQWKGLQSIAAIDCLRRDKKTGATSKETRFYISSLAPDPARLLAASRAHWSIENNLHWTLDVAFGEDDGRTRKDYSALNLAIIRHAALPMLKQEPTKIPIKRKRVKAAINPDFRAALLQC